MSISMTKLYKMAHLQENQPMTEIERAYLETNYSCAYCGFRGKESLTIDHIEGRSIPHANEYDNLIVLCHNCHHRKTNPKGITVKDVKKIKRILTQNYLAIYGINVLKLCMRNKNGVVAMPFLVLHLLEMGLLKQHEEQMGYGNTSVTLRYTITEKGKRVYNKFIK